MRPFQAAAQPPLCGQLRAGPEEAENFLVLRCCAYMPYPGTVQADGMLLEEGGWVTEGGREGQVTKELGTIGACILWDDVNSFEHMP